MTKIRSFISWLLADPWRVAFAGAVVVGLVFLVAFIVSGIHAAAQSSAAVTALAVASTEKARRARKASRVQRAAARAAQRGADARNRDPEPRTAADLNDRWGDL